jgi:1-deoxy-D-xylulose-5-phosphate reductoisomerase
MVEYTDGSLLSQMGAPDMQTPLAHCLGWPERLPRGGTFLDLNKSLNLSLEAVALNRFNSISLAYNCLRSGLGSCVVFNAANEIAVEAFLHKKIGFNVIMSVVEEMLNKIADRSLNSIADICSFDETVREQTRSYIKNMTSMKEADAA